jgi:S-adenosylmethionine hydrolase
MKATMFAPARLAMGRSLALAMVLGLAEAMLGAAGPIVYLTDFGTRDGAVAAMKGVAARVNPTLPQHDLTHDIQPFDIWEGAYRLAQAAPFWPSNTVFVCVVDPGVGTDRKPVVHRTRSGHLFVGPDNGLFTMVDDALGHDRSFVIDASRHRLPGSDASHTFHGRDLFAHVGARLASGKMSPEDAGMAAAHEPVRIPCPRPTLARGVLSGVIPVLDVQYGNVWSNIGTNLVAEAGIRQGDVLDVVFRNSGRKVATLRAPFVHTFGDVPNGRPLVFLNSLLQMSVALNTGNLAARHGIGSGPEWTVEFRLVSRKHPSQNPVSR